MERPRSALSRGGMSVPQSIASVPAPPRPGTASLRGGPTTTTTRPGTGFNGGGAGFRPNAGSMPSLSRPATQAATGGRAALGAATPTGGVHGGRRVLDASYFLNRLRRKNREVQTESSKLRDELESRSAGDSAHDFITRRHDALTREVAELRARLAEQNIVLEAVAASGGGGGGSGSGVGSGPDEIARLAAETTARNADDRKRVDAVFNERIAVEQSAKELEAQVRSYQEKTKGMIDQLPPARRREYESLAERNATLQAEVAKMEAALEKASSELSAAEHELARDQIKQRELALRDTLSSLTARKRELKTDEERLKLSPIDQRARLKEQIRAHNEEIAAAEIEIAELQKLVRKGESKLQEVRVDLNDQRGEGGLDDADKYDKLLSQEKELNAFIDGFDGSRAAALNDVAARKDAIVRLLEKISRNLLVKGNVPDKARFDAMRGELEYKKTQVGHATATSARLEEEKALRQAELEKIGTLEEKIATELAELEKKAVALNAEMKGFDDVDGLRADAEKTKARLERERVSYGQREAATRELVDAKVKAHDAKREQLRSNAAYKELEKLEVKMRVLEQGNHGMREYVDAREAESDVGTLMHSVDEVYDELNALLQKKAAYA